MYRKTKRAAIHARMAAMRAAKERHRLGREQPDRPARIELPEIRRVIEITDFDHGERRYRMELRRSNRIDCYDAYVNGQLWKRRIGWSRVQAGIRKALPRIITQA